MTDYSKWDKLASELSDDDEPPPLSGGGAGGGGMMMGAPPSDDSSPQPARPDIFKEKWSSGHVNSEDAPGTSSSTKSSLLSWKDTLALLDVPWSASRLATALVATLVSCAVLLLPVAGAVQAGVQEVPYVRSSITFPFKFK